MMFVSPVRWSRQRLQCRRCAKTWVQHARTWQQSIVVEWLFCAFLRVSVILCSNASQLLPLFRRYIAYMHKHSAVSLNIWCVLNTHKSIIAHISSITTTYRCSQAVHSSFVRSFFLSFFCALFLSPSLVFHSISNAGWFVDLSSSSSSTVCVRCAIACV